MQKPDDILAKIQHIAQLYDQQKDTYRSRAYRNAGVSLKKAHKDGFIRWGADDEKLENLLKQLPGVGSAVVADILEIRRKGSCQRLKSLSVAVGVPDLSGLYALPGVGMARAMKIHQEYRVSTIAQLKAAADKGIVKDPKLLDAIKLVASGGDQRHPRALIDRVFSPLVSRLGSRFGKARAAGSFRRGLATVKDLDIVIGWDGDPNLVWKATRVWMRENVEAHSVVNRGDVKMQLQVTLPSGAEIRVDLLIVPKKEWGSALSYFTGSKDHNVALRSRAKSMGLKLSEHGVFDANGKRVAGRNEKSVYRALGLHWFHPYERENSALPKNAAADRTRRKRWKQIEAHIRTHEFHTHSQPWSHDAEATTEQMVRAAIEHGLLAVGFAEHTGFNGFRKDRPDLLKQYRQTVKRLAEKYRSQIRVLCGIECDINTDGSLYLPDHELRRFDFVIGSVHQRPQYQLGQRLISAIRSGRVTFIGHPTTRWLGKRKEPDDVNWDSVFRAAGKHGVALEINASDERMDLPEDLVRQALEHGCHFVINADAHHPDTLAGRSLGLGIAIRAGLTRKHIITL